MCKCDTLTMSLSYSEQTLDSQLVNGADSSIRYGVNVAGFALAALYSSGFDAAIPNGANVPGATKVGREMSAAILYDHGPLSAGVTYDQLQGTSIATQSNTQSRALFGGSYDFGSLKALVGVRWLNVSNTSTPASSMLYWGGVYYHVSKPFTFSSSVYQDQYRERLGVHYVCIGLD